MSPKEEKLQSLLDQKADNMRQQRILEELNEAFNVEIDKLLEEGVSIDNIVGISL